MNPKVLFAAMVFLWGASSCTSPKKTDESSDQRIFDELSESLNKGILDVWYPRTIDSISGGFLSDFD